MGHRSAWSYGAAAQIRGPATTRYEYKTPGTRLWWGSVRAWCQAAHQIDRRRSSRHRNAALAAHASALPRDLIEIEDDLAAIEAALELLKYGPNGLRRPQRGHRAGAPQTARIMWLENRAAILRRAGDTIPPGPNWLAIQDSICVPRNLKSSDPERLRQRRDGLSVCAA